MVIEFENASNHMIAGVSRIITLDLTSILKILLAFAASDLPKKTATYLVTFWKLYLYFCTLYESTWDKMQITVIMGLVSEWPELWLLLLRVPNHPSPKWQMMIFTLVTQYSFLRALLLLISFEGKCSYNKNFGLFSSLSYTAWFSRS